MEVGIGLPNAVRGVDRAGIVEWSRRADAAGFSSLGTLDRIAYPNYESLIALAAAAAVTERIGLITDILIAPLRAREGHRISFVLAISTSLEPTSAGSWIVRPRLTRSSRPSPPRSRRSCSESVVADAPRCSTNVAWLLARQKQSRHTVMMSGELASNPSQLLGVLVAQVQPLAEPAGSRARWIEDLRALSMPDGPFGQVAQCETSSGRSRAPPGSSPATALLRFF